MLPASEHIFDLSLHLASVYVNPSQYFAQAVTVHSGLGPYTTFLIWCDHADMLTRNSLGVCDRTRLSPIFVVLWYLSSSSVQNGFLPFSFFFFLFSSSWHLQGTDPSKLAPEQARIALFRISTLGQVPGGEKTDGGATECCMLASHLNNLNTLPPLGKHNIFRFA